MTVSEPHVANSWRLRAKRLVLKALGLCFQSVRAVLHRRHVVVYYAWPDFKRKSLAIADSLKRAGIPVVVRSGHSFVTRVRIKSSPHLHIGFWNKFYVQYLPKKYVFYNAEPLSLARWRDNDEWTFGMSGAREVWGYSRNHEKYVQPLKVPYRYVPFGYAPYYEAEYRANTPATPVNEDIDVLFVGFVTPRRRVILDRIGQAGLSVHTVTYEQPLRGAALDAICARSKIMLSIFAVDDPEAQVVDLARLDLLLSNGRFVLHERPSEIARDVEFEAHVPTCSYDDIPSRCAYYVQQAAERQKIAAAAREWFRANRSLDAALPYREIREWMK